MLSQQQDGSRVCAAALAMRTCQVSTLGSLMKAANRLQDPIYIELPSVLRASIHGEAHLDGAGAHGVGHGAAAVVKSCDLPVADYDVRIAVQDGVHVELRAPGGPVFMYLAILEGRFVPLQKQSSQI